MGDDDQTNDLVKKLEIAKKYKKMNEILDKSVEALQEFNATSSDEDKISKIKDKLNNKDG